MRALWTVIYPELEQIPEPERDNAFHRAESSEFDGIELAGIAFGLIATSWLTRFAYTESALGQIFQTLLCFFIAAPLLVVLVGPFLVRRTRRGLRQYSRRPRFREEAHT